MIPPPPSKLKIDYNHDFNQDEEITGRLFVCVPVRNIRRRRKLRGVAAEAAELTGPTQRSSWTWTGAGGAGAVVRGGRNRRKREKKEWKEVRTRNGVTSHLTTPLSPVTLNPAAHLPTSPSPPSLWFLIRGGEKAVEEEKKEEKKKKKKGISWESTLPGFPGNSIFSSFVLLAHVVKQGFWEGGKISYFDYVRSPSFFLPFLNIFFLFASRDVIIWGCGGWNHNPLFAQKRKVSPGEMIDFQKRKLIFVTS